MAQGRDGEAEDGGGREGERLGSEANGGSL